MIPTQRMSAEAESAAGRYSLLIYGWENLYQNAVNSSAFGSSRQMSDMTNQAYALARIYLDAESKEIARVGAEIASEAQGTTLHDLGATIAKVLTDAVTEHLSASEQYLSRELSIQVERDIAYLQQSLRRAQLQVHLAAKSQGISQKAAQIQYRIGNNENLTFYFQDRGNRKWPSKKFVRAIWRQTMLSVYNETVLLTLSDHGQKLAMIQHVNPGADSNGMIIAMSSGTPYPTYAEIRNELFHPNADAILVGHGNVHSQQ